MKKFTIHKDYDQSVLNGFVSIDEKSEKLLSTGEYILAPSYTEDDNGRRLIQFGLIHESTLLKESEI